jgi:hypothetical protein
LSNCRDKGLMTQFAGETAALGYAPPRQDCKIAQAGVSVLLGAELGGKVTGDLAGAREVGGVEGDGGYAGVAAAAEFLS